jgi:hypothetical protein
MYQVQALRIPAPSDMEISTLPPVAQGILGYFSDRLEGSDYKNLARLFVDSVNGKVDLQSASLKYRNPELKLVAQKLAQIGEYNPDKIPISTYEKMRLDPQIALGTALIELPILSQNFRIECIDERIAAVIDAIVRPVYRKTVKSMLRSIQFGFAVGEKIFTKILLKIVKENENGGKKVIHNGYTVAIKNIKFVHPKTIRIERDDQEQIKKVKQTGDYAAPNDISIPSVSIEKCIWFANDAEYGNFFGNSRYKNSYQAWYFGSIVLQFALRYLERRGAPAAKGRAPLGTTTTTDGRKVNNIDMMLEVTNALISNSAVVFPSQFDKYGNQLWDAELVEDEQRGDLFLDMLRFLNLLKLRGLFVPDKTGVVEGSSTNATSEQSTDIHLLSEEALIQCIEDCLNEQLIDPLVRYNFPPTKQVPCYIKIERLNYGKRTLLKDVLSRMLMLYAGSMRDGNWPNWLPSVKKISEFLEIPGAEATKLFLPVASPNDKDGNNAKDDAQPDASDTQIDNKKEKTEPLEKQQKVKQRNKDASPRKDRTRRDRRSRERI